MLPSCSHGRSPVSSRDAGGVRLRNLLARQRTISREVRQVLIEIGPGNGHPRPGLVRRLDEFRRVQASRLDPDRARTDLGPRLFTLVETESARWSDYVWNDGKWLYNVYRETIDFAAVESVSVLYNNLPENKQSA